MLLCTHDDVDVGKLCVDIPDHQEHFQSCPGQVNEVKLFEVDENHLLLIVNHVVYA